MVKTEDIVNFCNQRTNLGEIEDFPGSHNGLQVGNSGEIKKIGASVDAGLIPFTKAIDLQIDFLITHHGLFWNPPIPITGSAYKKIKLCLDNNLAVYGSHLPLDCHPEIGNNSILAKKLGLEPFAKFLPFKGTDIGLITKNNQKRSQIREKLKTLFPKGFSTMEFGSDQPEKIAILTGSGQSGVDHIIDNGADTLITGELKQHHFNIAQELKLNLFACGHYATETFGVNALAQEAANKFDLSYEFVSSECPL
tara:strand:+ start:157 stop:912 length:756 start_codon:yes stop_codon:yes gene_type:complete